MVGILAIEEVQRLLLLNFTVVSKQPADFFCASSAAEDSLQPPAGRRSQLHTEHMYNTGPGTIYNQDSSSSSSFGVLWRFGKPTKTVHYRHLLIWSVACA